MDNKIKLEIRSVERGICLIAKSTMNELFLQLWPDALRMREMAIFPTALTSDVTIVFLDPISLKTRKFRRYANV